MAAVTRANLQNDGERLAALEISMCNVESSVDRLDRKIDSRFDELAAKLDGFIEGADQRYASKLTEKIVNGAAGLILVAVLGALVALVVVS